MGGTTFDVALIENGHYVLDEEPVIDRYTCLLPKVAVESVGAGGGSIVWLDDNNMLHVGPQSTGADPGPACYGAGGSEPTITDVNLVLGYLSPEAFLGGEMRLDVAAAEAAIDRVAARIGLDRSATAAGAFRIVNAHMADLIRRTSIDRGRDPRDFALFAYGGAGPLHVAYLARELGIGKVYVPSFATVFLGNGNADRRHPACRRALLRRHRAAAAGRMDAFANGVRAVAKAGRRSVRSRGRSNRPGAATNVSYT